jgi:hypothetical protein
MPLIDPPTFKRYLAAGRGQVYLTIQTHGLAPYIEPLLEACLYKQGYDLQSEGSRTYWIYKLFADTPYYPYFSQKTREYFNPSQDNEKNNHDVSQQFELLTLMALDRDQEACHLLEKWINHYLQTENLCFDAWQSAGLALKGTKIIIPMAQIMGKALNEGKELYVNPIQYLLELTHKYFPKTQQYLLADEIAAILKTTAQTDEWVNSYWCYCLDQQEKLSEREKEEGILFQFSEEEHKRASSIRNRLSLEQTLLNAKNKIQKRFGSFMNFGRVALEEEKQILQEHLEHETDDDVILRLLWCFRRTTLPNPLNAKVWQLLESKNSEVLQATITALSQHKHPKIGDYARTRLMTESQSAIQIQLLELFKYNYELGDELLIEQLLLEYKDSPDDIHDIAWTLNHIAETFPVNQLEQALRLAYEYNPCCLCRAKHLLHLKELNVADQVLMQEAQYDVRSTTRELASQWLIDTNKPISAQ